MSVEDELRTTLRERAAGTAAQPDLLTAVSAGVRRDVRRRRTLAGGAAAFALAAVASVPVFLRGGDDGAPVPSGTVTPGPSPSAAHWAPPAWQPPVFPLRPGWRPPAAGDPAVVKMGPTMGLRYGGGDSALLAEVGTQPPEWASYGGEQEYATSVGARRATVRTGPSYEGSEPGDRYVGVRWQLPDGRWIRVLSIGSHTEAQVLRFARGLGTGTVPAGPAPFAVDAVPPGMTLQYQSPAEMCLAPPEIVARDRGPSGVCMYMATKPPVPDQYPETLEVAGRPAAYNAQTGALRVDLGGGKALALEWDPAVIPLTRDDIVRLAAGIRPAR